MLTPESVSHYSADQKRIPHSSLTHHQINSRGVTTDHKSRNISLVLLRALFAFRKVIGWLFHYVNQTKYALPASLVVYHKYLEHVSIIMYHR